nr:hypothetical protein CFP56_56439 [Quercus suber]
MCRFVLAAGGCRVGFARGGEGTAREGPLPCGASAGALLRLSNPTCRAIAAHCSRLCPKEPVHVYLPLFNAMTREALSELHPPFSSVPFSDPPSTTKNRPTFRCAAPSTFQSGARATASLAVRRIRGWNFPRTSSRAMAAKASASTRASASRWPAALSSRRLRSGATPRVSTAWTWRTNASCAASVARSWRSSSALAGGGSAERRRRWWSWVRVMGSSGARVDGAGEEGWCGWESKAATSSVLLLRVLVLREWCVGVQRVRDRRRAAVEARDIRFIPDVSLHGRLSGTAGEWPGRMSGNQQRARLISLARSHLTTTALMSRIAQNILPLTLATVCGVATAYVTLQPVLEEQKEEREANGTFVAPHSPLVTATAADQQHPQPAAPSQTSSQAVEAKVKDQESAISRAILEDFREAGQQVRNSGLGWGFRNLWAGRKWNEAPKKEIGKGEGGADRSQD